MSVVVGAVLVSLLLWNLMNAYCCCAVLISLFLLNLMNRCWCCAVLVSFLLLNLMTVCCCWRGVGLFLAFYALDVCVLLISLQLLNLFLSSGSFYPIDVPKNRFVGSHDKCT